jgi:hypothetical protein
MSDDKGQLVRNGVKKGAGIVGKIIKWILIAILIIIALVIGYSVYTCTAVTKAVVNAAADSKLVQDAVRDATGGADAAKMASDAITVGFAELYSAYESNEIKADSTYKDKTIRLTGKVGDIGKDILNKPYIKFNADDYGLTGIQAFFKIVEQTKIGELDKGQTVTIVGICKGKQITFIILEDAFFE